MADVTNTWSSVTSTWNDDSSHYWVLDADVAKTYSNDSSDARTKVLLWSSRGLVTLRMTGNDIRDVRHVVT